LLSPELQETKNLLNRLGQPGVAAARRDFVGVLLNPTQGPRVVHRAPLEAPEASTTASLDAPEDKPIQAISSYIAGQTYYSAYPRKGDVLVAMREPQNRHDPNAVGLWLHDRQAGHLPRRDAAAIAPRMDAGFRVEVVCVRARGNAKNGAPIRIRVFEASEAPAESRPWCGCGSMSNNEFEPTRFARGSTQTR
jgi:hypothetical protein